MGVGTGPNAFGGSGQGAGLAGGGKGGGTGPYGGGAGYSNTGGKFSYGQPTGLSSTYSRNVHASNVQAKADAANANKGGAPNWLTSGQIRLDQDINPIPKGDLSGTNLSSESTETVEQPLSSADEAEARRRARSGYGGSGIEEREEIGLGG